MRAKVMFNEDINDHYYSYAFNCYTKCLLPSHFVRGAVVFYISCFFHTPPSPSLSFSHFVLCSSFPSAFLYHLLSEHSCLGNVAASTTRNHTTRSTASNQQIFSKYLQISSNMKNTICGDNSSSNTL